MELWILHIPTALPRRPLLLKLWHHLGQAVDMPQSSTQKGKVKLVGERTRLTVYISYH